MRLGNGSSLQWCSSCGRRIIGGKVRPRLKATDIKMQLAMMKMEIKDLWVWESEEKGRRERKDEFKTSTWSCDVGLGRSGKAAAGGEPGVRRYLPVGTL